LTDLAPYGRDDKKATSGSVVLGNTPYAMKRIISGTMTTFTTTRSSMDFAKALRVGPIRAFTVLWKRAFTAMIGV